MLKMRLFIGIRISPGITREIQIVQDRLKEKVKEARIVSCANMHVTLKFLGHVDENQVDEISRKLQIVAQNFNPFRIKVMEIGKFPDGKKVRILWAGIQSGNKLSALNKQIEENMDQIGFSKENRFKEHITIARFKSMPAVSMIEALQEKYGNIVFGETEITYFELIQSMLNSGETVYKTLESFNLKVMSKLT